MNKKIIWLIIGLMSAALIGVAGMQLKWVLDTLEANAAQFDNRVFDVLNTVVEKLEYQESMEAMQNVDNGWFREFYEDEFRAQVEEDANAAEEDLKMSFDIAHSHENDDGHVHLSKKKWLELILSANSCDCSNCSKERAENFSKWVSINEEQDLRQLPIESN